MTEKPRRFPPPPIIGEFFMTLGAETAEVTWEAKPRQYFVD